MKHNTFFLIILAVLLLAVPIASATTQTFYAGTLNDGAVGSTTPAAYATVRAANGNYLVNGSYNNYVRVTGGTTTGTFTLERGIVRFNTADLPDTCTITGVKFGVKGNAKTNGVGNLAYGITGFNATNSDGTFVAGDYQRFYPGREWSDSYISYASLSDTSWNNWTGNELFRTNVSRTGWTNVMVRDQPDILNNSALVTWSSGAYSAFSYQDVGFGSAPFLEITYTDSPVTDPWIGYVPVSVSGASPLTVHFTDISYNGPTAWNWWFRNVTGNNVSYMFSTAQNPSYTFGYGNYSVWLNASNSFVYNITPELVFVNVTGSGISDFTANRTSGVTPLAVKFYDLSNTSTVSRSWAYKANDSATWSLFTQYTAQNPDQVFTAGTTTRLFDINLTTTDIYGFTTNTIKSAYINVTPAGYPTASNFTANITSGVAPLAVQFTDSSTNTPNNWDWYFGNGTKFSDSQNPIAIFGEGTYTINLYTSNYNGGSWKNRTSYITASTAPPTANFVGSPLSGTAPLSVLFTDTSSGYPSSWYWSFGDGNFSTEQNVAHVYGSAGVYTVTLIATNVGGSDDESKTNYITVTAPTPTPTPTTTPTTVPTTIPTPIPTSSGGPQIVDVSGVTSHAANVSIVGITGSSTYIMIGQSSHGYTVRTPASTVSSSSATVPVSGVPYGGTTYYATACDVTGCGNEASFTTLSSDPLPETTYSQRYLEPFMANSWDFSKQAPILVSVFGDTFGNDASGAYGGNGNTIVIGSWFVLLITLYWLRQEDVAIPMFMTCILANVAFWTPGLVPEGWKVYLILVMVGVPIMAFLYSFISSGRES